MHTQRAHDQSEAMLSHFAPKFFAIPVALFALTASQSIAIGADDQKAVNEAPEQDTELAFVQAACGGCHAVEYPALSPNPAAPTFASIANRDGLDGDSLSGWLANAHNYPEVMDFDLDPAQVQTIARQMLRLRHPDYKPVE